MNNILDKKCSSICLLHLVALTMLVVFSAIIYSNSFKAPFVFDDIDNFVENSSMQVSVLSVQSLKRATFEGVNYRRWLPNLSLGLNYYFGAHEVWGYHLFNVVVHIMTAMVLYGLFFTTLTLPKLGFSPRRAVEISLISAMVWAVHPLQTNAVTYIVQRMTSMAALFYLASLLCYARGRLLSRFRIKRYALWAVSLVCGLLALACKENSAMLPPIIVAYEFYFFRERQGGSNYRKFLAVLGGSLISVLVIGWLYVGRTSLLLVLGGYHSRGFTLVERLLTETRIIFYYLSLIVLPLPSRLNLNYDYVISRSLLSPPSTLLATFGIIGLVGLTIYLFRRHRLLSFGLLWFIANLLIESTVIPLELVFEHRLYLPSSMLILSLVVLAYRFGGDMQQTFRLFWAIVIIVLCLFTVQRNVVWNSEVSLWQDVVAKSPHLARGYS